LLFFQDPKIADCGKNRVADWFTLGQHKSDNNSWMIQVTEVFVSCLGICWDQYYLIIIIGWFNYPRFNKEAILECYNLSKRLAFYCIRFGIFILLILNFIPFRIYNTIRSSSSKIFFGLMTVWWKAEFVMSLEVMLDHFGLKVCLNIF